jgi:membrane-associated protease RseP (regulator of RpoE activity)
MHRIPMVALNVDRDFSRAVGEKGYDALPPERRAEVGRPAPPLPAYEAFLFESFAQHGAGEKARRDDPAFRRFLEAQQVWDRAMAERIATARARDPAALVVGIMGTGHLMNGWGVPHQLRALGVRDPAVLLPWEPENDCQRLQPGYADAVFGLAAREEPAPQRPRLGLWLDPASGGVQIRQIEKGGLGEQAGLRVGDVLVEIAGRAPAEPADVSDAVQRQAPGTWLPLKVRREGRTFEVIAKFPPAAS